LEGEKALLLLLEVYEMELLLRYAHLMCCYILFALYYNIVSVQFDDVRYLEAKNAVDTDAMSNEVWQQLANQVSHMYLHIVCMYTRPYADMNWIALSHIQAGDTTLTLNEVISVKQRY
jgi:hypothetical protein